MLALTQCRHLPQAHRDRARMVAVVGVSRADDQASHQLSPTGSVVRCRSWFLDVGRPASELRTVRG